MKPVAPKAPAAPVVIDSLRDVFGVIENFAGHGNRPARIILEPTSAWMRNRWNLDDRSSFASDVDGKLGQERSVRFAIFVGANIVARHHNHLDRWSGIFELYVLKGSLQSDLEKVLEDLKKKMDCNITSRQQRVMKNPYPATAIKVA